MNGVNIAKIRCYFLCEPLTFFNISLAYKVTITKKSTIANVYTASLKLILND